MRLLVVVDTYVPARISAAQQMRDLVREMVAQGHAPTVVVPAPDLVESWRLDHADGAEILRVKSLRTKDVGAIRRVFAEWRLPRSLLRGLRQSPLGNTRWDGIVWYSPTIFLGPLVKAIKQRCGCRSYLILRDLFPDWAVDTGVLRKGFVYRYFKRVERAQYAVATVIGVQTPANIPLVAANAPRAVRVETLHNWLAPPIAVATTIDVSKGPLAGRLVLVYAGNMGAAQGMDSLIELARRMRDRGDIGFLFMGRGSDVARLRTLASAYGLAGVQFLDEIDADEVPSVLAQCHIGLIALDPRHKTHNIPGKLLAYLHAGLPVLARINPGNDLEGIIKRENLGRVVTHEGIDELQRMATELLDNQGLRATIGIAGKALVNALYSPAAAVNQIVRGLQADVEWN